MSQPKPDDDRPITLLEWMGLADQPDLSRARWVGACIGVFLVLFFALALCVAIVVVIGTIRDVLTGAGAGPNLGAGALIAALLGAPFLIWSTIIKHRELGFQKEGHLTDRISAAVEQLGAEKTVKRKGVETSEPNIEVRIGGILSLERIAQDSTMYDKGRDHVRVMEILCAYIRQNAPARLAKDHDLPEWLPLKDDPTADERAAHIATRAERFGAYLGQSKAYKWAQTLPPPRADIAIALRVIGRRTAQQRLAEARWGKDARANDTWVYDSDFDRLPEGEGPTTMAALATFRAGLNAWTTDIRAYKGYHLDLRDTCLQRADLSDLCLSGAWLQGARMEGANLSAARMEGANLYQARMEGAELYQARMEGADVTLARMEGADLRGARMEGANLSGARMEGANLTLARMEGADLRGARMEGANLSGARMEGANLSAARMEGANLTLARMEGANLMWARMEGANLTLARMEGANLSAARMEGANLTLARMEGADLRAAKFDAATAWARAEVAKARAQAVDFSDSRISMEQVKSMFGDASVALPNNITPDSPNWPAHWPKETLDWDDFNTAYNAWLTTPP